MHMRSPAPRAYFPESFRDAAEQHAHPHPPMKQALHRVAVCGSSEPPLPDDASGVHYVLFVDRNFHVAAECEYVVAFYIDNNPLGSLFNVSDLVDGIRTTSTTLHGSSVRTLPPIRPVVVRRSTASRIDSLTNLTGVRFLQEQQTMPRPLTTTEPCIYVCATCGSDKVACSARAVWNVPSQEWVSSTVFFEASCRVCQKPMRC